MGDSRYQICRRCIMDTSDPEILFDENGFCNHCNRFENILKKDWLPSDTGNHKLEQIIAKIKEEGKNRSYDCVIGLSGGVDSSYMALQISRFGLRILAVHVDGGWNSEMSVANIEKLLKMLKIDLYTYVVDWEEMKDLQIAFLKASVANQDIPQDHAFFATLYHVSNKMGIKYFLSGSNFATESILPSSWGYNAMDSKHLLSIHKLFGNHPLKTFPIMTWFDYNVFYPYIKKFNVIKPLNFMPYERDNAKAELKKELCWKDYGRKHGESRFTKFFQNYYLPVKFGFDKRRAHLSSMIVSGQITRKDALNTIDRPLYDPVELQNDKEFVIKKLGLSEKEFDRLLHLPNKMYCAYPNNKNLNLLKTRIKRIVISSVNQLNPMFRENK